MANIRVDLAPGDAPSDMQYEATIVGVDLIKGYGPTAEEAIKGLVSKARSIQRDLARIQGLIADVAQLEVEAEP